MIWKSFSEHLPKTGERIVIIHEWLDYDAELCLPATHYTIYECNYKSIKKDFYNKDDRSLVNFVNLKIIGGEKLYDYLGERDFYSKFTHWARLN